MARHRGFACAHRRSPGAVKLGPAAAASAQAAERRLARDAAAVDALLRGGASPGEVLDAESPEMTAEKEKEKPIFIIDGGQAIFRGLLRASHLMGARSWTTPRQRRAWKSRYAAEWVLNYLSEFLPTDGTNVVICFILDSGAKVRCGLCCLGYLTWRRWFLVILV